MSRVYRRAAGLLLALSAATLAGGCGGTAGSAVRRLAPRLDNVPLERFLESDPLPGAALSPDGSRLLVVSASGGKAALELISTSPFGSERLSSGATGTPRPLAWLPGGGAFLYISESDDASSRLLLRELAGREIDLSTALAGDGRFVAVAASGRSLFVSTPRDEGSESLLEITIAGVRSSVLLPGEAGVAIAAVAFDGSRVALEREAGPDSSELSLFEKATGSTRVLLPAEGGSRLRVQSFSNDGHSLYFIVDERGGASRVEELDLATGARRVVWSSRCQLQSARSGPSGRLALGLSCGGKRMARLLDTSTGAEIPLAAPTGTWPVAIQMARDAPAIAYEVVGGRWPAAWIVSTLPGVEPRPMNYPLAPEIDARGLAEPMEVNLKLEDGEKTPAELLRPPSRDATHRFPAIVWPESATDDARLFEFDGFRQFLASRGVGVLRFAARALPAPESEIAAARRILEQAGADSARIATLGAGDLAAISPVRSRALEVAPVDPAVAREIWNAIAAVLRVGEPFAPAPAR